MLSFVLKQDQKSRQEQSQDSSVTQSPSLESPTENCEGIPALSDKLFPLLMSQLLFLSCISNNKCKVVQYLHAQDYKSF